MVKAANKPAHKTLKLEPEDVVGLVRPQGRPKGSRNKITKEIRAIAGKYSHRAIRSVWKLAQHAENLDVQLKALTLILAYAHGRPVDRQETTGKDGTPLHPPLSAREQARRVALILTRPGSGGEGIVADLMEGTEGSAEDLPSSGRSGSGGTTRGSPCPTGAPSSSPDRGNGADKGGGGLSDARTGSGSGQRAVSEFSKPGDHPLSENFKIKKPAPKTEPEVGETARLGAYLISCAPPSREGLPPRYLILGGNGQLLTAAAGGWEGAMSWIRKRVGGELDMSTLEIVRPVRDEFHPVRPEQRKFATGGPDIAIRGHETDRTH